MTTRTASPDRWAAALARAQTAGLSAFTMNGDPRHWFVTSASCAGAGYTVEVVPSMAPRCGCKAGEHDPVCQHRAIVLNRLGLLPTAVPKPAPQALQDRKAAALAAASVR